MTGVGFLAYLIAWIVIPEEPVIHAVPAVQPVTTSPNP